MQISMAPVSPPIKMPFTALFEVAAGAVLKHAYNIYKLTKNEPYTFGAVTDAATALPVVAIFR